MHKILQILCIALGCLAVSAQLVQKTYRLSVTEDVTLERGSTNFNYLQYLIVGTHPGYPLKRSLLKFTNIPSDCRVVNRATLHVYFVYAHKASFMTTDQVPSFPRHIVAHRVLKSWTESQATSTYRLNNEKWDQQWLNLGTDASPTVLSSTPVYPTHGSKWYTLDITSQANNWLVGPNYGLLLRDTHEVLEGRDFRFASNAYHDASKRAYVTLTCTAWQQGGIITPVDGNNPV